MFPQNRSNGGFGAKSQLEFFPPHVLRCTTISIPPNIILREAKSSVAFLAARVNLWYSIR